MNPGAHEGQRIGRYELLRRLGGGGMGEVWEAVLHGPEGFRKPVALKLLRAGPTAGEERRALVREARIGALLQHPNVVGTHDLGELDGRWYVAMELVRGTSLAATLRDGPLPALAVVEAGIQVCAGLAHVHGLEVEGRPGGVVHRDLKPSNLLLDRTGLVKIADLGIARLAAQPGAPAGTPGYMSEEQSEGREDQRSDLFALGVTLFQLATGALPFGAGVGALYRIQHVEQRLADGLLAPVEAAVPGLAALLRPCLRRDPDDRWRDVSPIAAGLAELRAGLRDGLSLAQVLARARPDLVPEALGLDAGPSRSGRSRAEPRTIAMAPGNLPPQRDAFFGRAEELAELGARVRAGDDRLLVLKGPGGTGKTRLALAVAREVATDLAGGSWFVDCSDATSAVGVCSAVATAFQVSLDRQDPVRQIGRAFAYRGRALFVLDNLEQVVPYLAETLAKWLDLAPEATFLCTSRVSLRLTGERTVAVEPLSTEAGVDLFFERAPRPPASSERAEVERLVLDLEGLPLAIELAAARTRLLPVRRIRERLGDRLRLLSEGHKDRPTRQQSLTASLDASWDLLGPAARLGLAQAAAFEGGFALEAAEAVLDLSAVPDAPWAMDVLAELVDASLLRVDPLGTRFRMLLVVQAYARAKDPARAATEARHGAWFALAGTEEALRALSTHGGTERQRLLLEDLENLVAAARRAIARGDAAVAAGTTAAAGDILVVRGPLQVLLDLATGALELPGLTRREQRILWNLVASAQLNGGQLEAAAAAQERALALAEELGDPFALSAIVARIGWRLNVEGRAAEAVAWADRALEIAGDDVRARANALREAGGVSWQAGRLEEAKARFEEAIPLHRRLGDLRGEAFSTGNLGLVESYLGHRAAAVPLLERALARLRSLGDRRNEALILLNLGLVGHEGGRPAWAAEHYARAAAILGEVGDTRGQGMARTNFGYALHEIGRPHEARAELLEVLDLQRRLPDRPNELLTLLNLGGVAYDFGELGEARACWDAARAGAEELGHARTLTVALQQEATLRSEVEGDYAGAAEVMARALALAAEAGLPARVAQLQGTLARFAFDHGDIGEALRLASAAVVGLGDDAGALGPELLLGQLDAGAGRVAEGLARIDATIARLRAGGYGPTLVEALARRARVRRAAGDVAGAEGDVAEGRALLDRARYPEGSLLRAELARA